MLVGMVSGLLATMSIAPGWRDLAAKKRRPKLCGRGLVRCKVKTGKKIKRPCVNPLTDGAHCGGCGMACAAGQSSLGGACTSSPAPGDPTCTDAAPCVPDRFFGCLQDGQCRQDDTGPSNPTLSAAYSADCARIARGGTRIVPTVVPTSDGNAAMRWTVRAPGAVPPAVGDSAGSALPRRTLPASRVARIASASPTVPALNVPEMHTVRKASSAVRTPSPVSRGASRMTIARAMRPPPPAAISDVPNGATTMRTVQAIRVARSAMRITVAAASRVVMSGRRVGSAVGRPRPAARVAAEAMAVQARGIGATAVARSATGRRIGITAVRRVTSFRMATSVVAPTAAAATFPADRGFRDPQPWAWHQDPRWRVCKYLRVRAGCRSARSLSSPNRG